jgi:uncharacterized OB-fold protein
MTMSLKERITSVEKLRSWTDQIPFHYQYTAGVAGEKFLRGLREGRILASECTNCGKKYIPPKVYCIECYREIKRFRQVGPEGVVAALTESRIDFEGNRLAKPKTFAFIVFKGVTGGLIHFATGTGLEIGSEVVPKFRAPAKCHGTILDIEGFVKA